MLSAQLRAKPPATNLVGDTLSPKSTLAYQVPEYSRVSWCWSQVGLRINSLTDYGLELSISSLLGHMFHSQISDVSVIDVLASAFVAFYDGYCAD